MTTQTAEEAMESKKTKAEQLLADKILARDFARQAKQGETDEFVTTVLSKDIERYDLEIEALQAFIEGIQLEVLRRS